MRTNLGLRQLAAILAIVDHGSFNAAASQLHVSQPALSRTIRLVEESLGARVFDRDSRNVALTPAGEELVPIARRIVEEFSHSMSELSQFMEGKRGRVRISALPSMAQSLLVDAVAAFSRDYPQIDFLFRMDTAEQVLRLIEEREIDIGLSVQPPPDGRFSYQHLRDEEFVMVCCRDDPLVAQAGPEQTFGWSVFAERPFIAATKGSSTRTATDAAFMQAGIAIRPVFEVASSDIAFIGRLVAAGAGLSVLPASSFAHCLGDTTLVARRLDRPVLERRVGIVTLGGRTLSAATMRFCEHLKRVNGSVTNARKEASHLSLTQSRPTVTAPRPA